MPISRLCALPELALARKVGKVRGVQARARQHPTKDALVLLVPCCKASITVSMVLVLGAPGWVAVAAAWLMASLVGRPARRGPLEPLRQAQRTSAKGANRFVLGCDLVGWKLSATELASIDRALAPRLRPPPILLQHAPEDKQHHETNKCQEGASKPDPSRDALDRNCCYQA
eukprot:CAMPEP_0179112308 /NCGR_PEP_ID=MMETSP0796-20121207/52492_1 /TAXON_ID=73915 /ORGANISM="Pyrodinium bahamense, Strain pbaha01" /LENGTH=171 /DNA_ID=CAMNT_0020810473 /DNA_START=38 /DNA_END=554 /DNA_ORIENTATION=-